MTFLRSYPNEHGEKLGPFYDPNICWECTGSGWMIGNRPCKICGGTGKLPPEEEVSKLEENYHKLF